MTDHFNAIDLISRPPSTFRRGCRVPRVVDGDRTHMTRILALTFGLLMAAAALFVIGSGRPVSHVSAGPPHASIDDDSRARLDGVLADADR